MWIFQLFSPDTYLRIPFFLPKRSLSISLSPPGYKNVWRSKAWYITKKEIQLLRELMSPPSLPPPNPGPFVFYASPEEKRVKFEHVRSF